VAVTLTPVLIVPFMLFAGFFVATSSIPVWLREFEYISIYKYGYQALMQNEFTNNPAFECAYNNQVVHGYNTSYAYSSGCNADPVSQISDMSLSVSLVCLFGLYVLCYMISWLILWRLSADHEI